MPTTRGYRVTVSWTHNKWGPQRHQQLSRGSSARRALNAALLSFFKDRSKRQERRDAHAGFRCEVWRIPK
jgi:hypothetical protein